MYHEGAAFLFEIPLSSPLRLAGVMQSSILSQVRIPVTYPCQDQLTTNGVEGSWHHISESTQTFPQARSLVNTAVGMGCCQPGCKKINTRFWRRLLKLSWCQKQVRGHVVATAAAISRCERNETACYSSTLMGSVWEMSSKGDCRLPGNRQQESFQNSPRSLRMPLTYRNFSLKAQQQQASSPIVLYMTALMTSYSRVKP